MQKTKIAITSLPFFEGYLAHFFTWIVWKHIFIAKKSTCDKIPLVFNLKQFKGGDQYLTLKKKSVHC